MNATVNIRPEVNILSMLQHLNYKPWFALAEFVDNSIGSYLALPRDERDQPLEVSIELETEGDGRILIRDNAGGIELADFPRAFRAAQVPPDRSGLHEFGMGMKSAASWFARRWEITTSVRGEPLQRRVRFNLDEITANNIETLEIHEEAAAPEAHFTVVVLEALNHPPQTSTISKIRNHLSSIYRLQLRNDILRLSFRGEPLSYAEVEPLNAAPATDLDADPVEWLKDVNFTLPSGKTVTGFAGVRAVGSTSQAGFALFRRGRLVVGSHDEPYRPSEIFGRSNSYTYQRLYGELTLDGFPVSHTKDGFQWDDEEEPFLVHLAQALRAEPKNLLAQASGYRAKAAADLLTPIQDAASSVAADVRNRFEAIAEQVLDNPAPETFLPSVLEPTAETKAIVRRVELDVDSTPWIVDIEATLDDAALDWIRVGATSDGVGADGRRYFQVQVSVSLAHAYSRKFLGASNENSELIISIAAAFGLSLALGRLAGAKSYRILQHLNTLMRDTFSRLDPTEEGGT